MKTLNILKSISLITCFSVMFSIFVIGQSFAATFYVDTTYGDNNNDGLSPSTPLRDTSRVKAFIFNSEDEILFKKGKLWVEQLNIPSFTSVKNPIVKCTISGEINSIIPGSEVVTGWSQYVHDVWQTTLEIRPIRVKSNDTWLQEAFFIDELENNQWYWESNILYIKDTEGNPDETGKTIIAVIKNGGGSVTSGDFNGDGLSDVVTADKSYDGAAFNTGEVYIYYGNDEFSTIPDQTLTDPDGNKRDGFGFYVASAGDINNDGFDDLIVAMNWGVNKVYLYMGSQQGLSDTPDLTLIPPGGFPEFGFGHAISLRGGDINGDGFDDVLIGSGGQPNYFCVYYGSSSGINVNPDVIITYPDTTSYVNLSFVGDINNDGFDDMAVSVAKSPPATFFEVYVYNGTLNGIIAVNPLILTISIPIGDTYRKGTVAPAGDVNVDGFADLLIGNEWAFGSNINEGKAYIYNGSSSGLSDIPDATIDNPEQEFNGRFGTSVDGIGDFNHDGFGDIIVGSPRDNSFASIYCGSSEGVTTTPSITLTEVGAFGWSVSHAGDVKGNGQNFIIVGDELGAAFLYALNGDGIYPLLISNLTVASGQSYEVVENGLQNGALAYIDRGYTFSSVPASLQGSTYIKTANNDKASSGASFLTFEVNQDVFVYVAYDDCITQKPSWLTNNFADTGVNLVTTDTTLSIFESSFLAGTVTLGDNEGDDNSMYSLIVVRQGGSGGTPFVVSNLTAASGQSYEVINIGLQNGTLVYTDRGYTFSSVPASLQGSIYIKTANNDKESGNASFLTFEVDQDVIVYVAHDDAIGTRPSWLTSSFSDSDTGDSLVTTDTTLSIFKSNYLAGTVTLGGNEGGTNSMYAVIIVKQ